jgi:chromosome segregation ATPase
MSAKTTKLARLHGAIEEQEYVRRALAVLVGADVNAPLADVGIAVAERVEALAIRAEDHASRAELIRRERDQGTEDLAEARTEIDRLNTERAQLTAEIDRLRGAVRIHQEDTARLLDVVRAAQRFRHARPGAEAELARTGLVNAVDVYERGQVNDG